MIPFLEQCEYTIFAADICFAKALRSLALLPRPETIAPLSTERFTGLDWSKKLIWWVRRREWKNLLIGTIRLPLYLPCKAHKGHHHGTIVMVYPPTQTQRYKLYLFLRCQNKRREARGAFRTVKTKQLKLRLVFLKDWLYINKRNPLLKIYIFSLTKDGCRFHSLLICSLAKLNLCRDTIAKPVNVQQWTLNYLVFSANPCKSYRCECILPDTTELARLECIRPTSRTSEKAEWTETEETEKQFYPVDEKLIQWRECCWRKWEIWYSLCNTMSIT